MGRPGHGYAQTDPVEAFERSNISLTRKVVNKCPKSCDILIGAQLGSISNSDRSACRRKDVENKRGMGLVGRWTENVISQRSLSHSSINLQSSAYCR